MDDTALGFDAGACDGCGLCRPACPQGAIALAGAACEAYFDQDNATALVACALSGASPGAGVVPCLHALGERDVEAMAGLGVRQVVTARGDCATCPRATLNTFDIAIARVNMLRASRRQGVLAASAVSAAAWQVAQQLASARGNDIDQGRRGLLGLKFKTTNTPITGGPKGQPAVDGGLFRFVPLIDSGSCTGCDACTRICPHAAVTIARDVDQTSYQIEAAECTGCHLCVDVCEPGAITLQQMAPITIASVKLQQFRCSKCGAPFHRPMAQGKVDDQASICRICRGTNHAGLLFQVRE